MFRSNYSRVILKKWWGGKELPLKKWLKCTYLQRRQKSDDTKKRMAASVLTVICKNALHSNLEAFILNDPPREFSFTWIVYMKLFSCTWYCIVWYEARYRTTTPVLKELDSATWYLGKWLKASNNQRMGRKPF